MQKKLALIKKLRNFIFQVICNVYEEKIHLSECDFETTKIYSINILKFNNLITHAKQNLQIIMTVTIQKTYLNIIYILKRKNFQIINVAESLNEILIHRNRNVIKS